MNNSNTIRILTKDEAQKRIARWDLIKAQNAHFVWHPRCVDAVLNSSYEGHSWGGLCGVAARKTDLYEIYSEYYKTTQELALILYRKDTALRDLLLRVKAASVLRIICNGGTSDCVAEEVENILRAEYYKLIGAYSPVGEDERGRLFTQGFEAFIIARIRTTWKKMKYALVHYGTRSLEAMQEAGWEIAAPESVGQNVHVDDLKTILGALAHTLEDVKDWELFHGMVYGCETIRSYALRARSSKSAISRQAQLILDRLQSKVGVIIPVEKRGSGDIGQVTRLMGRVISEEEFLRAVPPPVAS